MSAEVSESGRGKRRPFSFEGSTQRHIGVLCIHGFTGSPDEMRPLGEFLAARGYSASGPVLPKHGGMPHELKGARWMHWAEAARDALNALAERCEHVFVAGLSMGGLLALHLAASECHLAPAEGRRLPITGAIIMAAPAALNDRRARLVRFARYVVPYYYPLKNMNLDDARVREQLQQRASASGASRINFDDPRERKQLVNGVRIPLDAIHELMQLNETVMRELPRIRIPTLFFQGRKDMTVAPDSAEVLSARITQAETRVVWFENSGHELPLEPDAPAMFEEIGAFIRAQVPTHTISR